MRGQAWVQYVVEVVSKHNITSLGHIGLLISQFALCKMNTTIM